MFSEVEIVQKDFLKIHLKTQKFISSLVQGFISIDVLKLHKTEHLQAVFPPVLSHSVK